MASKFGGSYSRVDLACFHGKTFWRVCLAGQFGIGERSEFIGERSES